MLALPCLSPKAGVAAETGATVKRVGVLTDNYPYSFRDEAGLVDGFAYELVREVEQVMGLRFERTVGSTEQIRQAFAGGRIDLLQSYAQFPEREEEVDFSVPYATMVGTIFVRQDETRIRTLADLRGRKVLVHRGSLGEAVLRRAGLADSIMHVDSVEQALWQLDRGEADATLASRLTGLALAHHLGLRRIRPLDAKVEGYDVRYCIAVREGDRELLARVNEGLAVLVRTGRFDEIYRKWFGHIEPEKYSATEVLGVVAAGLALAFGVAGWAFLRQRALHRRIARQAEALRVSEERHRGVFEGARDGLVVLGRGPEDYLVEQINPAATRLLADVAPGGRLGDLLAADAALAARLRSSAAAGRTEEFEQERAGGGWLRVGLNPLGAGRVLVALVDITEQVRARAQLRLQEEQLRQKQKLEAVGTLAGGVAHDFNNLLTSILGNIELALMGLPATHPEAEGLRQALQAARRASELVRQILAFSRQTAPSREVVALGSMVEETINLLRTLARNAVDFEVRMPGDLPSVLADPAQVHQVLMNLGTNAVQAMRGKPGRLSFHATVFEVEAEAGGPPGLRPGRYVRIGIQDTGPGMPPEVQQRVFEPFFTTKPPGEGTGLGLSVVHGIMQQHGGTVTLYSQPGRGTMFHLYFRAALAGVPPAQEPAAGVRPTGRGERVLLVDDDPTIIATAQKMLQQLGYAVISHTRAEDALAEWLAAPTAFALIISDLTMPEMDGLQLLARVHVARPDQAFILVSGFFSEAEANEAATLGAVELLPKPLSYDQLGHAVAASLGRK